MIGYRAGKFYVRVIRHCPGGYGETGKRGSLRIAMDIEPEKTAIRPGELESHRSSHECLQWIDPPHRHLQVIGIDGTAVGVVKTGYRRTRFIENPYPQHIV